MKHFGDITKIHGDKVPIVDIITGGSPCQDLSVAGKRAGLAGERSGLFMEQIRIVKEMRNESKRRLSIQGTDYDLRYIRPRYMVWENVAGAFSSGTPKGADFRAVLEEIIKVVVKEIPDIPIPEKGWSYAGCIEGMGDDGCPFSIAWRLHDAQYWGVPQRRKRIALVADFGGNSASKILFERKSLSGNTKQSEQKRETTSGNVGEGSVKAIGFNGWQSVTANMPVLEGKNPPIEATMPPYCLQCHNSERMPDKNRSNDVITVSHGGFMTNADDSGKAQTLQASDYKDPQIVAFDSYDLRETGDKGRCLTAAGGGINEHVPIVCGVDAFNQNATGDKTMPLTSAATDPNHIPCVYSVGEGAGKSQCGIQEGQSPTLATTHGGEPVVCYGLDRASFNQGKNAKYDFSVEEDKAQTIVSRGPGGVMTLSEAYVQETRKE